MSKEKEMKRVLIEVTRNEAIEMLNCLRAIAKTKLSVFIKFDIGYNIIKLKAIEETINLVKDNSDIDGFEVYQKGVKEIMRTHAKQGQIKGSDNIAAYEQDLQNFQKENPNVIEALEQKGKDLIELLKGKIEIEGMTVLKLEKFPHELEQDITPIIPIIER